MNETLRAIMRLVRQLRECTPLFIASTVVTALAQLTFMGVTMTSVWITTRFIVDNDAILTGLISLLIVLVASHALTTLLEVWWSHEVAYRILHTFRVHLYAAIKRIAPLGLHGKRTADVASAAMSDAEQLEWFYAHTASTAICAVINPVIVITVLCSIVGPAGLVMLFPVITMIGLPLLLMPLQQRQGAHLRDALVQLRVAVLDAIQGQRELRSLGMVAQQQHEIERLTVHVQRINNRQTIRKTIEMAYAELATATGTTILLVVLTGWVLDGQFESTLLPLAIVMAGMSTTPAVGLVAMLGRLGEIGACAKRITTILDAEDPIPSQPDTGLSKVEGHPQTLVADNLSFSYDVQPVLNQVSLVASPTRSIAIVGQSGAGKTTFANLAMRFLDPDAGQICFDGLNLRGYDPDAYRQQLALVPQDCHIFAGTVRQNLSLAKPEASDDAIWAALRAANIDHLVTTLGGLDSRVGDRGTTLSGGERQRIGIARAFLRNPTMLILDEPLANIDPFLERAIASNVRNLRDNRTTIVIAHRLASISIADHIVLLHNGSIEAQGTHQDLLANERYVELLGDQIER
ncbi:ABC transporter ATP-binding protein [Stomatohabitans albus]|uniref:ABC transporter ATP-binding protein n=1 Tax=Stomatohabitans albus TaxID=3110766 RepID=UPI00300CB58C